MSPGHKGREYVIDPATVTITFECCFQAFSFRGSLGMRLCN